MQHHSVWIELRSGAPGLDGPFLQEFRSPYQLLCTSNRRPPRIIMVIGGKLKRQKLSECCLKPPVGDEIGKICLRQHRTHEVLIVDCEMHANNNIRRIMGGPCPGHYHIHKIENPPRTISAISDRIYLEVLAPLSDRLLLFMDDFGGLSHTLEFLISWVYRAMAVPGTPKLHVQLILDNENRELSNTSVWFEISTGLLALLRSREPTEIRSLRNVQNICHNHLQLELQRYLSESVFLETAHDLTQANVRVEACKSPFVYHEALIHFAKNSPSPFNIPVAYAAKNPLPVMWQDHILEFIKFSQKQEVSSTPLLSSAFALLAFPLGTPYVSPAEVFIHLFESQLRTVLRKINCSELEQDIRFHFEDTVRQAFETNQSIQKLHLARLATSRTSLLSLGNTCSCCFLRTPSYTLVCTHRLCSSCVSMCGNLVRPWSYLIDLCPCCNSAMKENNPLSIRPPTAGLRVLHLKGSNSESLFQFLKDVEQKMRLPHLSLRNYFDVVIASGRGMFFAVSIFLEGWELEDCKYHLPRLRDPKYIRKDLLSFGHNLNWNLQDIRIRSNSSVILQTKHLKRHGWTLSVGRNIYRRALKKRERYPICLLLQKYLI